jgi:hypothetical protein
MPRERQTFEKTQTDGRGSGRQIQCRQILTSRNSVIIQIPVKKTYKRPRVADRGTLAYFCCGRSREISKSHLHRSEYRYSSHSDSVKILAKIRMSKSFLLSVCPINIQNGGNQFYRFPWNTRPVRIRISKLNCGFQKHFSCIFERFYR